MSLSMATTPLPPKLSFQTPFLSRTNKESTISSLASTNAHKPSPFRCSAKKKIGFFDQILDYIEGGPKLRKWYGAPDLLPKDGSAAGEEDEISEEEEERDAVFVTDGDSDIGQRTRVKALVKDKRTSSEAFGDYVESVAGDVNNKQFLNKALRGVRTIICPTEGFLSSVGSLKGIKHVILLSQLSVYEGASSIQGLMSGNARSLAEQDELKLMALGVPHTIIKVGMLKDTPGGGQGFYFDEGSSVKGSLSKEDAAMICVEALNVIPQRGFTFEVVNGEEKVSDWGRRLFTLMEKGGQKL